MEYTNKKHSVRSYLKTTTTKSRVLVVATTVEWTMIQSHRFVVVVVLFVVTRRLPLSMTTPLVAM
jgi:hypothetical protein